MSELQTIESQSHAVMNTLQTALEKGVDADSLEKLLNMQERVLDRHAEQAYTQDMVKVQSEVKRIEKNRKNEQTRSEYADLDAIISAVKPVYTEHGFSVSFGTADSPIEGHVRVTADVMHVAGFSKPYFADIPLDVMGIKGNINKTEVHGRASAISYGRRYLHALIFNLSTGDDDDGNSAGGDSRTAIDIQNEWKNRMLIIKTILPVILDYKEAIAEEDYLRAYEAYESLTDDEKRAIYHPAPTEGGILTTREREALKSNEMSEARKYYNDNQVPGDKDK